MMTIFKKLKSSKGETLVETLFAMMILALVSGLLFLMINGAHQINLEAAEKDALFFNNLTAAETQAGAATDEKVAITYSTPSGVQTYEATIKVYGNAGLLSYKKEGP